MAKFKGFSKETLRFFEGLKNNNTKNWFDNHRRDYDEFVLHPTREFVESMGEKLRRIAPGIKAIPKINQSIFKINRDVRFSIDKSPYKTCLGIRFWEGSRKRMECSGFYFHLENKRLLIGTGIYMFPKPLLDLYRHAVVDKKLGAELQKVIKKVSDRGYQVSGKHYKRVPRGFDAGHKNAEYLQYNGLHAAVEQDVPDVFYSSEIADYAFSHYQNMNPLHRWLKMVTA